MPTDEWSLLHKRVDNLQLLVGQRYSLLSGIADCKCLISYFNTHSDDIELIIFDTRNNKIILDGLVDKKLLEAEVDEEEACAQIVLDLVFPLGEQQ
jgi:hypothetical protein